MSPLRRGRAARPRPERLRRLLAQPGGDRGAFADGWLRTGDVAECDDEGYYRIKGRLKDMYISGGENVYPAEVEAVLHEHPAVADAAVVGVPDERWGEVGVAFVVLERPDPAEEELASTAASGSRVQGAARVPLRRRAAAQLARQGRKSASRGR